MRNRTPKLIFQGNQREAKKWIPWAMKALTRIKNLTVTGIANKVLRPVTGVAVHVWSVNDIDRIRIAVALKGGCKFPIIDPATTIVSEFQLECPEPDESKRRIHFEALFGVESPVVGRTNKWDFDDPSGGINPSNTDTTVRAYGSGTTFSPTLTVGDGFVPATSLVIEGKTGTGASNAIAYADWVSKPWTTAGFGAAGLLWRHEDTGSFPRKKYTGTRITVTYDITGTYILDPRNTAFIYGTLFSFVGLFGLIPHGSGIKSDYDGVTQSVDDPGFEFTDLTPAIGNSALVVVYTDLNNYAMLPNVSDFGGDQTGYTSSIGVNTIHGRDNEYRTTKTIKVDVRGITKQVGASVHERLSPSA